jgi:hypothetical protein
MKYLVLIAAAFSLSGCHQTTVNANEGPYGGDDAQPTFRSAQKLAVAKLKNLRSCALPLDTEKTVADWLIQNSKDLAQDIESSPHTWVRDDNVPCARTSHKKGSTIIFSYTNCERISPEDAFKVLVHESVHHMGITEEAFPTQVALDVFHATDGNCIPETNELQFLEKNIVNWPETAQIKSIEVTNETLCYDFSTNQVWPEIDPFNVWKTTGNYWVIAYINNTWLASTYEWILPALRCEEDNAHTIGAGTKQVPFTNWVPKSGELVGFMVSSVTRMGHSNGVQERSPIYWMRWP